MRAENSMGPPGNRFGHFVILVIMMVPLAATAQRPHTGRRSAARVPVTRLIAYESSSAAVVPTSTQQPTYALSGHIRYYSNALPLSAAMVQLQGATPAAAQTDASGQFAFNGLDGSAWRIEPRKLGDARGGISALDAVYVLQAAAGRRTLTAAQRLACDVNGDGTLSALDAELILQFKVGLITRFSVAQACASDWAFIPVPAAAPNQQLTQPQMTAGICQPGAVALQPLTGQADNQDFSAVLFGDCTGNWQPPPLPDPTTTPTQTTTSTPTATYTPSRTPTRTATTTMTRSPTRTLTATPTPTTPSGPSIGGCPVFPADNPWNRDISGDPVDPNSDNYIASINLGASYLHADFGSPADYGIPYVVVPGTQPMVPITFNEYGDESDPGPYPIPANAPVEAGDDRHVLVLDSGSCVLYELYHGTKDAIGPGWSAGSGAIFDLRSNALRPDSWTSCDQAGLPILPGLVRYDEVTAGVIKHAVRFTVWRPQRAWVHPATHYGSSHNLNDPPMGLRVRLKASFNMSGYTGQARVVLQALRTYGMFVADTGSSWFITGATDPRWNDTDLDQLKTVPGSAFEVVQLGPVLRP